MNRTDAIKAHKLSPGMVDALTGAAFREHATGNGEAGYVIHDMHPRTRKALHDRGLMYGHYYLTRTGVEVLATLAGNVVDTRGYEWDGNILRVAAYVETYAQDTVTVEGGEPNTWAPDFDAQGAAECYFGCGRDVVAVFMDYVGRTEGLCGSHRDRVEGMTYDVPATPENGSQNVQEETQDMSAETVVIPGVNALDMGERSYNRFVGIGESSSVPGSMFTYGLATAISKAPGMNGTGKVNIPCEFGDVITVRTSLGDIRYVVSDNRYSATGPRKGDPILTRYESDDVRCYVCTTHGDNSMPGKNVDGEWVCGYCVANNRTPANLDSHNLSFYVETENAGTKYECGDCGSIDTHANFAEFPCESDDAGFVETESADDYAIGTMDTPLAPGESVTLADGSIRTRVNYTGTTHHSVDSHGGEWTRFDHVLTVGDVVKITGMQGVYEVHALIPGLPVAYVLGTTGEPFPVGATKLYAL
jgi:hypothetical protein